MKTKLELILPKMRCPLCGGKFQLQISETEKDEVIEGLLCCGENHRFGIHAGVVDFAKSMIWQAPRTCSCLTILKGFMKNISLSSRPLRSLNLYTKMMITCRIYCRIEANGLPIEYLRVGNNTKKIGGGIIKSLRLFIECSNLTISSHLFLLPIPWRVHSTSDPHLRPLLQILHIH